MIYCMMYVNEHDDLEMIRYNNETKDYIFANGNIDPKIQLEGADFKRPQKDQVFLSYEISTTEAKDNDLKEVGANQSWLKPIGEFRGVHDTRSGSAVEHAYQMMRELHKMKSIPAFFDNIICMLKKNGILLENGAHNPDFKMTFEKVEVFQPDGNIAPRVLH